MYEIASNVAGVEANKNEIGESIKGVAEMDQLLHSLVMLSGFLSRCARSRGVVFVIAGARERLRGSV